MYIYILLSICAITAADTDLWDLFKGIINLTHKSYVPEDANLNITQLAHKYGYPIEEHKVTTEDGYIINFHRIPPVEGGQKRPIVFLMHGIMECSDSWLLMGPGKGLAYVLADHGFDVWMGNARGNKHALSHATMNYTMTRFWEFSWEEIGVHDLPAMIDYILEVSGKESLYYIGHSQGTTSGYVLCSMKPEYNNKIKIMFSLAPEAWMGNVKSPLVRFFSPAHNILGFLLEGFNTLTAGIDYFNKISAFVCSVLPEGCDNILFALSGYETKVNETFLAVILGHMPTGASTRQFVHYGQLVESQRFCRFDYGPRKNMIRYGQNTPPDYDLKKVTVPVVIYSSAKDWLSDQRDVDKLIKHLPNVLVHIQLSDFTHVDYIYAAEAVNVIYDKIIDLIIKYAESNDVNPHALQSTTGHNLPNSNLNKILRLWC